MMISKAKIKFIRSLEQKKARKQEGVFVAEGPKVVGDLLAVTNAAIIVATKEWMDNNNKCLFTEYIDVTEEELKKVSFLQHPQQVLAVFNIPHANNSSSDTDNKKLILALDGVQDPGNMGTIIRIADWFGITDIFCSEDSADVYNPKVVQATMGSIARVNIRYVNLMPFLDNLGKDVPVYGTVLDGTNIYEQQLSDNGVIIMGNEGKGISPAIQQKINNKLFIPNYPAGRPTADSLNVAIATAITCSEFRRNEKRNL